MLPQHQHRHQSQVGAGRDFPYWNSVLQLPCLCLGTTCSSALLLPRPCQHRSENFNWPAGFYITALSSALSEGTRFNWEVTQSTTNKAQLEAGPYTDEVPQEEGVKWTRKKPRQDGKMLGQSRRISSWCLWIYTAEMWGNLGEDGVIKSQERQKMRRKEMTGRAEKSWKRPKSMKHLQ